MSARPSPANRTWSTPVRSSASPPSFDPQPFHLDEAAAERSLFKGLAASGWLPPRWDYAHARRGVPLEDGLVGAELQLAWPADKAGQGAAGVQRDRRITPSRSRPHMAMVTMRNETRTRRNNKLQIFTVKDAGVQAALTAGLHCILCIIHGME